MWQMQRLAANPTAASYLGNDHVAHCWRVCRFRASLPPTLNVAAALLHETTTLRISVATPDRGENEKGGGLLKRSVQGRWTVREYTHSFLSASTRLDWIESGSFLLVVESTTRFASVREGRRKTGAQQYQTVRLVRRFEASRIVTSRLKFSDKENVRETACFLWYGTSSEVLAEGYAFIRKIQIDGIGHGAGPAFFVLMCYTKTGQLPNRSHLHYE